MVRLVTLVTTLVRSAGLSGLPGLDPDLSCVWSTIDLASLTCSKSIINDSDRTARRDYQPTDDDAIRARLQTLGFWRVQFIYSSLITVCSLSDSLFLSSLLIAHTPTGTGIVQCWRSKEHCTFTVSFKMPLFSYVLFFSIVLTPGISGTWYPYFDDRQQRDFIANRSFIITQSILSSSLREFFSSFLFFFQVLICYRNIQVHRRRLSKILYYY